MLHTRTTVLDVILYIAVVMGQVLLVVLVWDWFWRWWGTPTHATCAVAGFLATEIGGTVGLLMACAGLIGWALTAFRDKTYLVITAGGFILAQWPGVLLHYLGVSC